MLPRTAAVFLLLAALALTSCSVNQTVAINGDGSGTASLRVVVSRLLKGYLLSLAEAAGQPELAKEGRIFDLKEIRRELQARDGVTLTRVASPSPDTLDIELAYRSLSDLFVVGDASGRAGAVTLTESGGEKTLAVHLDKRTFRALSASLPLLQDPAFQGLGPQESEKITREDYLSMIEFALGANAPGLLKSSSVVLTIRPEGGIIAQSGGSVANGAVTFRIPILAILVLDKPLDYMVRYR